MEGKKNRGREREGGNAMHSINWAEKTTERGEETREMREKYRKQRRRRGVGRGLDHHT